MDQARPTLLPIRSIADAPVFGVNGSSYGRLVQSTTDWERETGLRAAELPAGGRESAVLHGLRRPADKRRGLRLRPALVGPESWRDHALFTGLIVASSVHPDWRSGPASQIVAADADRSEPRTGARAHRPPGSYG